MRMMLLPAVSPLKTELAMLSLFAGRLLLILGPCYLLCTGVTLINGLPLVDGSDISRDDGVSRHDVADYEGDNVDSEDTPHSRIAPPRRNKKRVLTNTKLFYFLQSPPSQLSTSESQRSQVDQIADKSDYNYEYNGHSGGYSHDSPNSYKAIHIHSPQPVQYHGKSEKEDKFWPLLLLSFLPILFGSLILLPLLISFFTQVLQLLALMQNTINNINTTTPAPNNNNGRRRRRHISKLEVDYYPNGSNEVIEQITRRLSRALLRFDALKSSSTS